MKEYQKALKNIGWPTEVLILDFESYFDSDYSLTKMSTIEYICSPQFELTGLGYQSLGNGHAQFLPPDLINNFLQIAKDKQDNIVFCMHHARFDATVLQAHFEFVPPFIIDTEDLARHYDARMSHRLKDLAKLFGLEDKGDTGQFKGLHWEDMTEFQKLNLEIYTEQDIKLEGELFEILWKYLTNPEIELLLARHTLNLYLKPKFSFNFELATELQEKMSGVLQKIIGPTGLTPKQLGSRKEFPVILQNALPEGETVPTKQGKKGPICALAKTDVGMQLLLAHTDDKVRQLCEAKAANKSWPSHIKRVESMMAQAKCSGGVLPVALNYYGAHTGRWSGAEKINLQNLGGRGRAGAGNHPLIGQVRKLLCTPEGQTLLISDSSQIEARILAWFAGQADLLQDFANGEDIYSVFATGLFGEEVRKPRKDDHWGLIEKLKIRRGFGKDAILGCGYGMGASRFYDNCRSNPDLRPMFDSGQYNFVFIERLIKTYRTKYSKIPEFWKAVESAFKWVVKYPHETRTLYDDTPAENPRLVFWNEAGTVNLQLPSGRVLYYRHASINKKKELRWQHGHLYGALLVENLVQACARDLLACWILEMEKQGLPVVLTSHDEIVCIVPIKNAEADLQKVINIMSSGPGWSFGLPMTAEGKITRCYEK